MSTAVSAAVWQNSNAQGTALLLLVSLADQANDDGWCWPSTKLIAQRCRISKRTVQRLLIQLEASGELIREEQPGSSTHYKVTPGGDIAMSPVTDRQGRHSYVTGGVTLLSPRNVSESITKDSLRSSLVTATQKRRGTRLPDDWDPSRELIAKMRAECPDVDLRAEHLKFRDYWIAQPGQRGVKLDWEATWRNWIRNAKPTNGHKQPAEDVRSKRLRQTPDPIPPADLSPAEQNAWLREARRRIAEGSI